MTAGRITSAVQFNTGISTADWTSGVVGQTPGQTQKTLLPGSTTVSEALNEVFATETLGVELLAQLAAAGGAVQLRTSGGFGRTMRRTIRTLRGKKGEKADAAARELEALLADTELLDRYRAALLES